MVPDNNDEGFSSSSEEEEEVPIPSGGTQLPGSFRVSKRLIGASLSNRKAPG
jgi:hypothetical protein